MSVFPQLGKIPDNIIEVMNHRTGKNTVDVSKMSSWIRVASTGSEGNAGMILESLPTTNSFHESYGKQGQSGRVGTNFKGESIFVDGTDRSFRPSPTIDSVSIENGSNGLSRKARFDIKCYTLSQSEIISKYFLEPGFVVLVEIGWNDDISIAQRAKLSDKGACEIAKYNNYNFITKKRRESNGTYDGFMGYITGGGLKLGDGGSYTISVELTTLGEIPAYLQTHRQGTSTDPNDVENDNSGIKYGASVIDNEAQNQKSLGSSLFKQMFNRLPLHKQTQKVKDLINEKDWNGEYYSHPGNFINMDDEIRETFAELVSKKGTELDGIDIELPEGVDLFQDSSFIRMELAFKILNTYFANLKPSTTTKSECSGVSTYNFEINSLHTVVRAHPHMFSLDSSKLYIPNTQLPNFGLASVLQGKEAKTTETLSENTIDGSYMLQTTNDDEFTFPSVLDYTSPKLDGTYDIIAKAGTWGYLRNTYLNFEYFLEILSSTNLVAKDIYYTILNDISAAVNSYWEFEINELPTTLPKIKGQGEPTYDNELKIVDVLFLGGKPSDEYPIWSSNGVNSPFLSVDLNIDIPAIMRNSLLGQRSSKRTQTQMEGYAYVQPSRKENFFSTGEDQVVAILNSFNVEETNTTSDNGDGNTNTTESESPDEKLKRNLEIFMGRATLLPKNMTRGEVDDIDGSWLTDASVSTDLVIVGTWNDSTLLTKIRQVDEGTFETTDGRNPAILAIDFGFDIHGTSGIKVGDVFRLNDLPSMFNGVFQVMNISHNLTSGLWKTTVNSKMRNM